MTARTRTRSGAARVVPLLKFLVAAVLVGLVLHFVPVRDRIDWPEPGGGERALVGRIVTWEEGRAVFSVRGGDAPGRVEVTLSREPGAAPDAVVELRWRDGRVERALPGARLREGILTVCSNADPALLALGILFVLLGSSVAIVRWSMLLRAAGAHTSFPRAVALTFIGLFFNNVMPGLTGGDLVKAVYIARQHPSRKTEAILTVLLDRVLGITGLALVAACVVPFRFEEFSVVAPWIYGLLGGLLVGAVVLFSRRVRARLKVDAFLSRLPLQRFVQRIDQALFLYRYRKRVVLVSLALSMTVHLVIVGGVSVMGRGVGLDVPPSAYFAIMPIVLIVMALPVSPAGIGTGEAAGIYFWASQGVSESQAVSLLLVYRMSQLVVSLLGGVFLALERDRVGSREMEDFEESTAAGPRAGGGVGG